MSKLSLVTVSFVALVAAAFASADALSAQPSPSIDYLRVTSYGSRERQGSTVVFIGTGYEACQPGTAEWSCRHFAPTGRPNGALRNMLATMGSEGWELVSVFDEDAAGGGMTYLFKRPARVMPRA